MLQPRPDVPLWTRDLSRAPYYRARDGSGISRRGGRVFCSDAGGSQRKRPQRRKCKNRRTQGEFKRTARRRHVRKRARRGRSVVPKTGACRRRSAVGADGLPPASRAGFARRRRPERRRRGALKNQRKLSITPNFKSYIGACWPFTATFWLQRSFRP